MSRPMIDYEEELMKVWSLVNELSEQLANNRALVQQLKSRTENVKGQAVHVGAGFPLRRFNLDISDEEFQTELEAFASHLVLENQTLQHENKQLNTLLKEYEQTLETVMGKFRGIAHSSQQHDLALHSYYTQLLQNLQTAHSAAQLHDDATLSLLLTRLSTLLRSALRSVNGDEGDVDEALAQLNLPHPPDIEVVAPSPRPVGSSPLAQRAASPAVSNPPSRPGSAPRVRAPPRRQHFQGFVPGSSGGYYGTEGQADWWLEREMEIQRLEEENRALREMLGIAEEAAVPEEKEEEREEKSPLAPNERRLSSLTAEDLEADAEKERLEALYAPPQEEHAAERAPLDEGVLGFRAEAENGPPPEENVFDETDGEVVEGA